MNSSTSIGSWWSSFKSTAQAALGLTTTFSGPILPCTTQALQPFLPSHATITNATLIPQNGTWSSPSPAFPNPATNLPPLCVITVNVISSPTSNFNFGLFLPEQWNLRFMGSGNGGFGGGINWGDMQTSALSGFASISTDTGHLSSGFDASWALNNPETQVDWGHRALHLSVQFGKLLTEKYYGQKIKYSYFSACSTGGRQGLKSVQMYPEDFDGVVVAAPAWWTSHLQPWHLAVSLWNLPVEAKHHIPSSLYPIIAEEVMRQCDPQDGVVDGIISNPEGCVFVPENLLCTPKSKAGSCLNAEQLGTLDKIHGNWVETNNTFLFPALSLGSETEFGQVMNRDTNSPAPMGTTWISNFLMNSSEPSTYEYWTSRSVLDTMILGDKMNPGNANADNFDLSPFAARGGKMIHYHGYSDGLIPAMKSVYFLSRVQRMLIPKGISVPNFYKLYLVPGLRHCSGGIGNAPWYLNGGGQACSLRAQAPASSTSEEGSGGESDVEGPISAQTADPRQDVVLAIQRWVEEGIAPEELVATKWKDNVVEHGVERQRKICAWPARAEWDGSSDVDNEGSWKCVGRS